MKQDAFSAGVEPGGLWHKNDIRILLCYILASVGAPLSRGDLTRMIQEKGLANYFEVEDALAALAKQGNILLQEDGACAVTEAGREIARSLDTTLPSPCGTRPWRPPSPCWPRPAPNGENQVELQETDRGWQVKCHISGGDMELMSITLYVPRPGPGGVRPGPFPPGPGRGLPAAAGRPHRGPGPVPGAL